VLFLLMLLFFEDATNLGRIPQVSHAPEENHIHSTNIRSCIESTSNYTTLSYLDIVYQVCETMWCP
jgi:hypothetical protein